MWCALHSEDASCNPFLARRAHAHGHVRGEAERILRAIGKGVDNVLVGARVRRHVPEARLGHVGEQEQRFAMSIGTWCIERPMVNGCCRIVDISSDISQLEKELQKWKPSCLVRLPSTFNTTGFG